MTRLPEWQYRRAPQHIPHHRYPVEGDIQRRSDAIPDAGFGSQPRAGIERRFVERTVEDIASSIEDVLRTVAMVDIPVGGWRCVSGPGQWRVRRRSRRS